MKHYGTTKIRVDADAMTRNYGLCAESFRKTNEPLLVDLPTDESSTSWSCWSCWSVSAPRQSFCRMTFHIYALGKVA